MENIEKDVRTGQTGLEYGTRLRSLSVSVTFTEDILRLYTTLKKEVSN